MNLRANDLKGLVKSVFEIDSYKSKIGYDEDIIVLSFTVEFDDPAKDLESFIELGYDFVLDSDVSQGEGRDGDFKVFVEFKRTRHAPTQIIKIVDGIKKLTGFDSMKFRYYKSFKSREATLENLENYIPKDPRAYKIAIDENMMENFSNFFSSSYVEDITLLDESITFKSTWGEPIKFNIITSGFKHNVYESISGPLLIEGTDIAQVLYLTKYIGNYNITKIGTAFIFEHKNYAVALELCHEF